ncbi:MAG: NADH-quinone oxidoreductase subunit D [Candidatus Izimaplasma sp.]|nr:NADH-quinone oxidoreductase subunit D [Candidatus Izimaplasma bacterium]
MRKLKLFLGPQHPGMHGNAAIHMYVEGDIIKKSYLLPGMLHRGFEKGMERHSFVNNISLIPRVCVVEPDINELAFAMAVEKLADLKVPERAEWIRMIIMELARISIHLMAYGGLGGPTGNYTLMYHAHADRNTILGFFERITGHRVYHQYIVPGGVRKDLPNDGIEADILDFLTDLENRYDEYRDLGIENPTLLARIKDTILLPEEVVWELGVTGIGMRSAVNKPYDIRKKMPYCKYDEVEFNVPVSNYSDARSRVDLKLKEVVQSIRIIRQCIDKMPEGKVRVPIAQGQSMRWTVPKGHVYSVVESSRGEFGYYMVSNGGTHPYRVGVRGASYPQGLLGIEKYMPGTRIDDAALWVDTMGVCSPEIDR